jgi:type VI secretion system protein ImpH
MQEPFRFQFFQAMRLLQRLSPQRNIVGRFVHPSSEAIRFVARASLSFPASEVHSISCRCPFCAADFETSAIKEHVEACQKRAGRKVPELGPPNMALNFMGLTGPEGVLPLCYTEFVMERTQRRDTAIADFLDIFNHRFVSLFYQAWEKYHFTVGYERGERDRLSQNLADLIGLGTGGLQKRLAPDLADESLFYYAGLLAQSPHSAVALEQILSDYFQVPVAIDQFAGRWYRLDKSNQTSLNENSSPYETLGLGTVVGDEVWDQQSLVRIRLGPLALRQYLEFLPGRAANKSLRSLVQLYSGEQLDYEVQLVLKKDEVPACELGNENTSGPQLGWVTWMKSVPLTVDPGDTVIRL